MLPQAAAAAASLLLRGHFSRAETMKTQKLELLDRGTVELYIPGLLIRPPLRLPFVACSNNSADLYLRGGGERAGICSSRSLYSTAS